MAAASDPRACDGAGPAGCEAEVAAAARGLGRLLGEECWSVDDDTRARLLAAALAAARSGSPEEVRAALAAHWDYDVEELDRCHAAAASEQEALGVAGPALDDWVELLEDLHVEYCQVAAAAGERGDEAIAEAVLSAPHASLLNSGPDGAAEEWDPRPRLAESWEPAAQALLKGALRAGAAGLVRWLAIATVGGGDAANAAGADAAAPKLLPRLLWEAQSHVSPAACADAAFALLGGRVLGGPNPRPPAAEGPAQFELLEVVVIGWPADGAGLSRALWFCKDYVEPDAGSSPLPPLEDGALLWWLATKGWPPAWAGVVDAEVRDWLLDMAAGGDALRLALQWLDRAELAEQGE